MGARVRRAVRCLGRGPVATAFTGFAAGVVVVAIALGTSAEARTSSPCASRGDTIGQLSSDGLRATLTACKTSGGKAPTATVFVSAHGRSHGRWQRLGRPLVVGRRDGWFWYTVARRFGVEQLSAIIGGREPLRLTVRLLISPAIGPSAPFHFAVVHGRLQPVHP